MPDPEDSKKAPEKDEHTPDPHRRKFVTNASRIAMIAGLGSGYGMLGVVAGRYLYPADRDGSVWQFVSLVEEFPAGTAVAFEAPNGEPINIMRREDTGNATDFVALSSTCPHLGCQVNWEAQNDRFFCPCHNGAFDASGLGTAGPPEGQSLAQYPLLIEDDLLFVRVPTRSLRTGQTG